VLAVMLVARIGKGDSCPNSFDRLVDRELTGVDNNVSLRSGVGKPLRLLLVEPGRPRSTSPLTHHFKRYVEKHQRVRSLSLPERLNGRVLLSDDIGIVSAFPELGDNRRFSRTASADNCRLHRFARFVSGAQW
jgi:hypothetical protein